MIFAEPSNSESDQAFAESIQNSGNVVLASDLSEVEKDFISGVIETRPLLLFEEAGAEVGLAGVNRDADMVVRYAPEFKNTLSSVAFGKEIEFEPKSKIIRYIGPDHSFSFLSYFQLFIENGIPEGFFGRQGSLHWPRFESITRHSKKYTRHFPHTLYKI